jgi:hypothetical protein
VLSGGYRAADDALVVNVELADTAISEVMWAKSFARRVSGLLAQDDDLVNSIVAGASQAIMSNEDREDRHRALPTLDAGTLLLGGIGLMHRTDRRDFDKSRHAFEHLIERYPRYATPYAYLAEWHVFRVAQGWFDSLEHEAAAALDRVNRALDLDAEDSLALTVNGMVHTNLLRKHDVAKHSYDLALQRNPNAGLRGCIAARCGRSRDAVAKRWRRRSVRCRCHRSIPGGITTTRCPRRPRCPHASTSSRSRSRTARCAPTARMRRRCGSSQ